MKKILYVHGLGGGANGRVSGLIADNIGDGYIVDAPEIPLDPKEALAFVRGVIEDYDMAVGSSLGAFYLMLSEQTVKKILINPAVKAGEYVEKYIGKGPQTFHSKRENGEKEYIIDDEFINSLNEIHRKPDAEERLMIRCFVSPEDELFGEQNAIECRKYFNLGDNLTDISGPHSIEEDMVRNVIVPAIKEFMDYEIEVPPWIAYAPYIGPDFEED